MIDTRIAALVAGASSLVFGGWAALGDTPELGLASGVLGLLAGALAIGPRALAGDERAPAEESNARTQDQELPDAPGAPEAQRHADAVADVRPEAGRTSGPPQVRPEHAEPPAAEQTEGPAAAQNALTDQVTGLFSEEYLRVALESRLASARRHLRPVAVALLEVTAGLPGESSRPANPSVVADAIRNTVRDSDIACRLGDGTFGVILEDTPENGAVWTVERIRRNLVSTSGHHTLWAGVACYPAHAFDGDDLMEQVRVALTAAREWNQDRIEVAVAE